MAGCANTIRVTVIRREIRVIECRSRPGGRGMARIARCREARGLVIRIGGPVVIGSVATVAGGRQRRVVVIHVALRASHVGCVISGEREGRVVVVEGGTQPIRGRPGCMAGVASRREAHLRVRRAIGAVVVRLVTGDARRACQTVRT
jgi:hypothetical protein